MIFPWDRNIRKLMKIWSFLFLSQIFVRQKPFFSCSVICRLISNQFCVNFFLFLKETLTYFLISFFTEPRDTREQIEGIALLSSHSKNEEYLLFLDPLYINTLLSKKILLPRILHLKTRKYVMFLFRYQFIFPSSLGNN